MANAINTTSAGSAGTSAVALVAQESMSKQQAVLQREALTELCLQTIVSTNETLKTTDRTLRALETTITSLQAHPMATNTVTIDMGHVIKTLVVIAKQLMIAAKDNKAAAEANKTAAETLALSTTSQEPIFYKHLPEVLQALCLSYIAPEEREKMRAMEDPRFDQILCNDLFEMEHFAKIKDTYLYYKSDPKTNVICADSLDLQRITKKITNINPKLKNSQLVKLLRVYMVCRYCSQSSRKPNHFTTFAFPQRQFCTEANFLGCLNALLTLIESPVFATSQLEKALAKPNAENAPLRTASIILNCFKGVLVFSPWEKDDYQNIFLLDAVIHLFENLRTLSGYWSIFPPTVTYYKFGSNLEDCTFAEWNQKHHCVLDFTNSTDLKKVELGSWKAPIIHLPTILTEQKLKIGVTATTISTDCLHRLKEWKKAGHMIRIDAVDANSPIKRGFINYPDEIDRY